MVENEVSSAPPTQESLNEYDFYVPGGSNCLSTKQRTVETRRKGKWDKMIDDWNSADPKKVKERVRKGIPREQRKVAWPLLTGSFDVLKENPGKYASLLERSDEISQTTKEVIQRDLHRTLPNHILFRDADAGGQDTLRRILYAYAVCDPKVGYVQGMGFITGALMVAQLEEEPAFWTLVQLMKSEKYHMHDMYLPGFPRLRVKLYQLDCLIEKFLPKLSRHFRNQMVQSSFYATQWFLTLYVYQFPDHPHLLMRILDIFMNEGWKIMFRIALALLKLEQETLLKMDMEGILPYLKELQNNKDVDQLMREVLGFPLKSEHLDKAEAEYYKKEKGGG